MTGTSRRAAALVAAVSAMLIAGALAFQWSGYAPCEMCMWQRWAHAAAATVASLAMFVRKPLVRPAIWLAILCIAASGAIAVFHAGVEWKMWEGITTCSARFSSGDGDVLVEIMKAPIVRCDEAAWRLFGLSMAGYNAIISLGVAALAACMVVRSGRHDSPPRNDRKTRMKSSTFGMIKPDATARGVEDAMISDIEAAGFTVDDRRRCVMTRDDAEWLYREHAGRDHFQGLVDYTVSGEVVMMLLSHPAGEAQRRFRDLMGPTDRTKAPEGTLRNRYAVGYRENSVHGSDSPEAAAAEIDHFFG